ncbi:S8 family serine peptidase [Haloarchaeobius iranensis]
MSPNHQGSYQIPSCTADRRGGILMVRGHTDSGVALTPPGCARCVLRISYEWRVNIKGLRIGGRLLRVLIACRRRLRWIYTATYSGPVGHPSRVVPGALSRTVDAATLGRRDTRESVCSTVGGRARIRHRGRHRVRRGPGMGVSSSTLGGSSSCVARDDCQYAVDNAVFLVAAAGNSGQYSDCVGSPASYSTVVAVSSTVSDDTLGDFSSKPPPRSGSTPRTTNRSGPPVRIPARRPVSRRLATLARAGRTGARRGTRRSRTAPREGSPRA